MKLLHQSKAETMASKAHIDRLAQRIEVLATRFVPPESSPELWIVEADTAYQPSNPEHVITYAELEALPTGRTSYPTRIKIRLVHADNGRPAACCQPGGACNALHGATGGARRRRESDQVTDHG
jgi:hypothetical protein